MQISVQSTPNPNALKFILEKDVKTNGKVTFENQASATEVALASKLFDPSSVNQVHFFENVITISKEEEGNWEELVPKIEKIIEENIDSHNPNFESGPEKTAEEKRQALSPDLLKIEEILDRTIRPALQGDGGDLEVISLEKNLLTVHYEGACGSCPSSTMGTLEAIKGILRDEFNPELEVITE